MARTLIDDEIARTEHPGVDPYESTVRDELLAVLEWGRDQELITEADCQLLADVVAAAATTTRRGCPDSIPLLGDVVSERVAARWGVSGRTVRRHARRSIAALAGRWLMALSERFAGLRDPELSGSSLLVGLVGVRRCSAR